MRTASFLQGELQKIHSILKENLSESSFHFEYENLNIYELLNHVNCEKIFYFKSKYSDFSFLGLGHSETVKAVDLDNFLKKYPKSYLVAAFLFEQDLESCVFNLPEWIFVNKDGKTELTINKSFEYKNFATPNLFFNTNFDLNLYDPFIPPWQSYEETPEHDQWSAMIGACDKLFESGELEKIVLSRKKIYDFNEPLEPIAFFKSALEKNNHSKSNYAIFYQIKFGESFITLTPEKLFSIEDNVFESISLAASAPRGADEDEDKELEKLLTSSDKLIREHNLVTEEILRKIKPFSESVNVSSLQTMKLPYIQHRSVSIKALLLPNIGPLELLNLLHPTPAVGGLPWDKAKTNISDLEPYARNHYAAPIGIISAQHCELAVGIRCALIEASKLTLFGGAGIIKGSIAEEEWIETGIKMNPFLKVVNHE